MKNKKYALELIESIKTSVSIIRQFPVCTLLIPVSDALKNIIVNVSILQGIIEAKEEEKVMEEGIDG